jgi:hypothetical protein
MTVQELIDELNSVENKDMKVIIRGTDPTDWTYYNEIESSGVEKIHNEDIGENEEDFWEARDKDEDEDEGVRTCFVIDGGLF